MLRAGSQATFTALFVFLLLGAGTTGAPTELRARFFFALDPLLALTELATTRSLAAGAAIAVVPIILTLIIGRFFCGWVCPMGAINHFFSWLATVMGTRAKAVGRRWYRVKYLVLVAVVVMAVAGTRIGIIIDPIALLARSLAVFVLPATGAVADPWVTPVYATPQASSAVLGAQTVAAFTASPLPTGRLVSQATAIGVLFLVIVLLNLHSRRFFCNVLCPLGALYGLLARFSLFRVRVSVDCSACGTCAERCPSRSGPQGEAGGQECLLCMSCVADCPSDAATLRPVSADGWQGVPFDIGRRQLFASAVGSLGVSAASSLAPERRPHARRFLRPPGALPEDELLDLCVRCGQCIQGCPTNFIQPSGLEAGIGGLWTPVVDPSVGYCAWDCNRCTQACPTGAIRPLALADKRIFKIGTAVVDRSRCYTWADGMDCTVCADRCPVSGAATLREASVWAFTGVLTTVRRIHVDPDRCTGCGICEHACPRLDTPGIVVGCDDERRESFFDSLVRLG